VPICLTAQDAASATPRPPEHFYRLHLTVEQLNVDGKVQNTRNYVATIVNQDNQQNIRTGARVPIATGSYEAGSAAANMNTQYQYIDVGVNFDVRKVREIGDKLEFDLVADISSLAPMPNKSPAMANDPVIRQNKWDSMVVIPIGKPTIVFSADDLDDKGTMQVELTATRVE
jgi:hypothetical protein